MNLSIKQVCMQYFARYIKIGIFISYITYLCSAHASYDITNANIHLYAEKFSHNNKIEVLTQYDQTPITQFYSPASTLKIVTALAAKLGLPENFTFKTNIVLRKQDLSIIFNGDPLLTLDDLSNLLGQLKKQNISHVKGNLWLDNSVFNGHHHAIGTPWDILGLCYSAPTSSIIINKNCVAASLNPNTINGIARVFVPKHQAIYASSKVKVVSAQAQKKQLCDLQLFAYNDNKYQLQGCLIKQADYFPLNFALTNPDLYAVSMIKSLLKKHNIRLDGAIKIGKMPQLKSSNTKLIASHNSITLDEMIKYMLHESDNLVANSLIKTLGSLNYTQAGNFTNGILEMKKVITAKTNIDLSNAQLVDGSGLSRSNKISPITMLDILRYIAYNDHNLNLLSLMPHAGKSGTLEYRKSMRSTEIQGKIIAKSGMIYGTYNMVGYGLDENGKANSIFMQFIENYFPPAQDDDQQSSRHLLEEQFYRDVINFSRN